MLPRAFSLLALLVLSTFAPAAPVPLVVNIAGDLWSWTSARGWTRLTHRGHHGPPVLSPDGRRVAYASVAEEVVQARRRGEGGNGWAPTNLWVLDPTTCQASRLTTQPPGKVWHEGLIRSAPAWSPDGEFLAWTQNSTDSLRINHTLVLHSLSNSLTQVSHTDAPDYLGVPAASGVLWSPQRLVMLGPVERIPGAFRRGPAGPIQPGGSVEPGVSVLDTAGRVVRRVPLPVPVTHLIRAGASVSLSSLDSSTLHSLSGEAHGRSPAPERLVAVRAARKLSVRFVRRERRLVCQLLRAGRVARAWPCEPEVGHPDISHDDLAGALSLALSPDGGQAASVRDGAVFIHDGQQERRILNLRGRGLSGMVWGPVKFRVL